MEEAASPPTEGSASFASAPKVDDVQDSINTFVSDDNKTSQYVTQSEMTRGEDIQYVTDEDIARDEMKEKATSIDSEEQGDDTLGEHDDVSTEVDQRAISAPVSELDGHDSILTTPTSPQRAAGEDVESNNGLTGSPRQEEANPDDQFNPAVSLATTVDVAIDAAQDAGAASALPAHLLGQSSRAWRESSAFDALDESWVEPQVAAPGLEGSRDTPDSATPSALAVEAGHTATQELGVEGSTPSTLLRPGPSSPTYRLASHQMPAAREDSSTAMSLVEDDFEAIREPGPSQQRRHDASPVRSGRSLSSSSSGEKQGSRALAINNGEPGPSAARAASVDDDTSDRSDSQDEDPDALLPPRADLDDETGVDKYGSAREHMSYASALVGAVTAEEPTFIEHSQVIPTPEFLKPDWAKKGKKGRARDIFTPLQLETMFNPPSFTQGQPAVDEGEGAPSTPAVQAEAELSMDSSNAVEGEETTAEASMRSMSTASISQEQGAIASESVHTSQDSQVAALADRTGTEELEALSPEPPVVPQCTFTFASPAKDTPVPPPTPAAGRPPLRLFHLRDKRAEVEQILNTPRSPEKAADARRIVWELVGHGNDHTEARETKRLRLDQLPHMPQLPQEDELEIIAEAASTSATEVLAEEIGLENVPISQLPRESTPLEQQTTQDRERPRFMDRLQKLRAIVDRQQIRTNDAADRRAHDHPGAHVRLAARTHEPVPRSERKESPRKMLRHWSAANEVDEELSQASSSVNGPMTEQEHAPVEAYAALDEFKTTPADGENNVVDGIRTDYDKGTRSWVQAHRRETSRHADSDPFGSTQRQPHTRSQQGHQIGSTGATDLGSKIHITVSDTTGHDSVPTERSPASTDRHMEMPMLATPARMPSTLPITTPRSILKTGGLNPRMLPSSLHKATNRSISFAEGPEMRSFARSERVEKVEELLKQLAVLALGPDEKSVDLSFLEQLTPTRPTVAENTKRARSPWNLSMLRGHREVGDNDEASFLTNASFHVAHDRLLELITDVAPYEDDWRDLLTIDLRGRRVDSLNRMKEFLPRLEHALLDDNEISYLSGLPSSLRSLSVARNRLPTSAAFGTLVNLETLDVSHNTIDLKALTKLTRLRHLRADENNVASLDGIETLSQLETLHLRGNRLKELVIRRGQWPHMRDLVLSHNGLTVLRGVSNLQKLRSLNLDHNDLREVDLGRTMASLRQLRLSGNARLATLDVGPARSLRTLYADECALDEVLNIGLLQKLDNLSLRQQLGSTSLHWPAKEIRDIKRLFLSGNAFRAVDLGSSALHSGLRGPLNASAFAMTKFYGMVYLELSACQLTSLPEELADMVPNLRHLNADYNLLHSLPDMTGLKRLKRLSLVGCRIDPSRALVESLQGCDELLTLDVRLNPCTLGLYAPIMLAPTPAQAGMSHARAEKCMRAFLPPIPHPSLARPDKVWHGEGSPKRRAPGTAQLGGSLGEKSFFNKKHPPPFLAGDVPGDMSGSHAADSDDDTYTIEPTVYGSRVRRNAESKPKSGKDSLDADAFVASDNRFARTLPAHFRLQRLLHRGTLAMACARLTWLDGILIDEDEVRQADEYYRRRLKTLRRDHDGVLTANISPPESLFSSNSSQED